MFTKAPHRRLTSLLFFLFCLTIASSLFAETATFTYDALNRLTSANYGTSRIEYGYDSTGNINSVATQYKITVNKSGTGSGRISSIPEGIDCGSECTGFFGQNNEVTLMAVADPGSIFAGWSGDVSGEESDCIVTADGAKQVTATFNLEEYSVTALANGNGLGSIISDVGGINYQYPETSSGTSAALEYGCSITITATASEGSTVSWGDCSTIGGTTSGNGTTTATVSFNSLEAAKTIAATFSLKQYTVIAQTGQGGSLDATTPSPVTVNHGATTSFSFRADSNHHVASVNGCAGTSFNNTSNDVANYTFTTGLVTGDCMVSATFELNHYQLLTVKDGNGSGTITSNPSGINCGTDCSEIYDHGTLVTLTATPDENSIFSGWGGEGCSGTAPCTVTVDSDKMVTATFTATGFQITANSVGNGLGSVTSNIGGISFSYPEQSSSTSTIINAGTAVTLTATATEGSTVSWGDCTAVGGITSGNDTSTATVSFAALDDFKTVTATFTALGDAPEISLEDSVAGVQAAVLKADVTPNGQNTEVWFQWASDTDFNPLLPVYTQASTKTAIGNGSDPITVQIVIDGLNEDTTYHFRCLAENFFGLSCGEDHTFLTGIANSSVVAIDDIIYLNLDEALNVAADQDVLKITVGVNDGPVTIDMPDAKIKLEGGWDFNFNSRNSLGETIFGNSLVINSGSIVVEGITIK